jgi:hypothetical protein
MTVGGRGLELTKTTKCGPFLFIPSMVTFLRVRLGSTHQKFIKLEAKEIVFLEYSTLFKDPTPPPPHCTSAHRYASVTYLLTSRVNGDGSIL